MPFYEFIDTITGEKIEKSMKISERDQFVQDNPHLKQQITGAPAFARSSSSGLKNDDGWKENLSRIAEAHPTSALASKVGGRSSAQVKSQEIAKKHGFGKTGSYADGL